MRSYEFPGRKLLSVVIALALSPPASAIEIVKSSVEVKDGRYVMLGESIITAPRDFVFDVLADYDNFHKLASGVAESYYLPPGENGEVRGYVRVESCVLIFCRALVKVERVDLQPPAKIVTVVEPEGSDFKFYTTYWTLEAVEAGTRVIYRAELVPDFWIPPIIGPWAIRRKFRKSADAIGSRIEFMHENGLTLEQVAPAD